MPLLDYYTFDKLLSYNGTYNYCVGGRGMGKTYGAKKKVLKDAIKTSIQTGDQFIYLRRYKTELTMSRSTFFADIEHEFPEYDFKVFGFEAKAAPAETRNEKKREWFTIGYFIPLVVSQNYKSVNFPRVKTIIFDEFIIEKGALRYLPDETTVFNNFYSTVDRYKDKTRVFFLANSAAMTNPYFIEYQINPDKTDINGIMKLSGGFQVCHFVDSDRFSKGVYKTRFGKFIQGSDYADYAVGNNFADNTDSLIGEKTAKASYLFTLEGKHGTFSIWFDKYDSKYYAQAKRPSEENLYTLLAEKMDSSRTLMTFQDKPLSMLRTAFRHANIAFDMSSTRNAFIEIFKR